MTYGVPYSFVPGTKAKASEVNANFIDVLEKIEDSNSRITQLEENKADNSDIDGIWTIKTQTLADNVSLTGSSALSINISGYLPNDSNIYEVLISGVGTSSSTSGQACICFILSDIVRSNVCIFRDLPRTSSPIYTGGNTIMPVGTGRRIELVRSSNYYGTVSLTAVAYRKVR